MGVIDLLLPQNTRRRTEINLNILEQLAAHEKRFFLNKSCETRKTFKKTSACRGRTFYPELVSVIQLQKQYSKH